MILKLSWPSIRRFTLFVAVGCCSSFFSTSEAQTGSYALFRVRSGNTLATVASRYRIRVDSIIEVNGLSSQLIYPGQVLKVPYIEARGGIAEKAPPPPPGFRVHTLQLGETVSSLLSRYDITVEALVGANPDLSSLDRLPSGIELLIPPSEGMVVSLSDGQSIIDLIEIYGVHPVDLARANDLRSPQDIREGAMLFLPGVKPVHALDRLAGVRAEENRYVWPSHGRLTSYFGRRTLWGRANFHSGIDIAAPHGTPIAAARSGQVVFSGWSNRGYGYMVRIRHSGGSETWYAHASRLLVNVGDYVEQGDIIARVGSTGISTGPHLHFEIHENGQPINPLTHLQ